MKTLSGDQIENALAQLPGWKHSAGALRRSFVFADFVAAMGFVDEVAQVAESAAHHPDIEIRYNRVTLALMSHDAGGVTSRDVDLALKISVLADEIAPAQPST